MYFQQSNNTVELVNNVQPGGAALAHVETTHTATIGTSALEKLLSSQASARDCQNASKNVGFISSVFTYGYGRLLVGQALVDRALQKYILVTLRIPIRYLSHYPIVAGHPRQRRMYHTMTHHFSRRRIANDLNTTVK